MTFQIGRRAVGGITHLIRYGGMVVTAYCEESVWIDYTSDSFDSVSCVACRNAYRAENPVRSERVQQGADNLLAFLPVLQRIAAGEDTTDIKAMFRDLETVAPGASAELLLVGSLTTVQILVTRLANVLGESPETVIEQLRGVALELRDP